MKRFLNAGGGWLIACVLAASVLVFVGCEGCTAGKGQYNPASGTYASEATADPLVVSVENIRETALGAFDNVMRLEKLHEATLLKLNPKIHVAVEGIRRDGPKALNALTEAKVAYQKSRSAEDATKLRNALGFISSLLNSAVANLAAIADATKGNQ